MRYIIKFSNGERYSIAVRFIAEHRARYYCKVDDCSFEESLKETQELFKEDSYEIKDWAKNNMNWSDVVSVAEKLKTVFKLLDFEAEWIESDVEIIADE